MVRRSAVLAVVLAALVAGCGGVPIADSHSDWDLNESSDGDTDEATDAKTTETTEDDGDDAGDAGDDAGDAGNDGEVDGTMEVHFINVGQADATLIVGPTGETMLIDSGDWRNDGQTVIDYLEAHDVDRIDHLVSTHGHADHIGGHAAVIDYFETEKDGVGAVYDSGVPHTSQTYENYLDAVKRHDVRLFEVREGDLIEFSGVDVTVLNPAEGTDADDLHDDSVALHLAYGNTSVLFTGDAEMRAEERMLEAHGDALDADVYQAGHHGSNTSTTDPFVDAVDPVAAVVSSSYDSQYGHPNEETLGTLAARDVDTFWTATHGTTVMTFDGTTVTVATQADASVEASQLRTAPEVDADPIDETEDRRTYESPHPNPSLAGMPAVRDPAIRVPTAGSGGGVA